MICRHSSCSLPDDVQLYKTSFHNHGDRWRLWIRPVILRTKKINKNKPLFCIYESDEWTKTWKLCNTRITRKIYPWAEKCKFISILENVSPQHRIDVRRIWIFLSIWWRVHRCNWRKKYITKTKFIITASFRIISVSCSIFEPPWHCNEHILRAHSQCCPYNKGGGGDNGKRSVKHHKLCSTVTKKHTILSS